MKEFVHAATHVIPGIPCFSMSQESRISIVSLCPLVVCSSKTGGSLSC